MELTYKSKARMLFTLKNTDLVFRTMITLTYPQEYPHDGKVVKRDLREFLQVHRRDCGKYEYIWFLEFQKRGAPHIHLLTTIPPDTTWFGAVKKSTSLVWYKVVDSGDIKHLHAGTRVERIRRPDGALRYAAKYCSKKAQKEVPKLYRNVGRFWGCSKSVRPLPMFEVITNEDGLKILLDVAEIPPYSTLFDKSDVIMRSVPEAVLSQTMEIAGYTGEKIEMVVVDSKEKGCMV